MVNRDGEPVWFELVTSNPEPAQDFYAPLLGWTVAPSPAPEHGGYRLATAPDGEMAAGLMAGQDGMPTGWFVYFGTSNVDVAAEKVKSLGGAVHVGPMDIPHVGRFAYASDPQGIGFYLMTGSSPQPSTAFKQMAGEAGNGHGVWVELATPDPDAALHFYGALFGWGKQGAMPMGPMGDYVFVGYAEKDCPGAIMSSATTGAAPRWNMYFQVPDIDAAVTTAKAKGGSLVQGPDEIPGGAFSANLIDAQGHQIGVVGPRK